MYPPDCFKILQTHEVSLTPDFPKPFLIMKKKLQTLGFLMLFALMTSMPVQANNGTNYSKVKTLRTEIISLIKKPDLSSIANEKETVKLSFLVNNKKEVVVVDASTQSEFLENYIKNTLNYQQIKTEFVQLNKIYHIKVVFKK